MIMPFLTGTSLVIPVTPARNEMVKSPPEWESTAMVQCRIFYSFSYYDLSNTLLMLIWAPLALDLALKDSSISGPNLPGRLPGPCH